MKHALTAALALIPQAAWAHGDHAGLGGVLHALTSPEHLAVLLLAGTSLGLMSRRGQPGFGRLLKRRGKDAD